jgi:hypothetical protein
MAIRSLEAWIAFVTLSIATWIAKSYLWRFGSTYDVVLWLLAILCLLLACRIVFLSRARFRAAALCLVGLLVGQWWLTGTLLAFAAWSTNGFGG